MIFQGVLLDHGDDMPSTGTARRQSENGNFSQSLRQAQIIILEILQCIPVFIIFAFLDLEKNISFSDSLLADMIRAYLRVGGRQQFFRILLEFGRHWVRE
jgi:hypothetical protein